MTQFDPLERFLLSKVQSFVAGADLEELVAVIVGPPLASGANSAATIGTPRQ